MSGRGMRGRKRSAVPLEAIAISQFTAEAEAAGLPVQPGKGALGNEYRAAVESTPPARFSGSVDLDAAFLAAEPREPR